MVLKDKYRYKVVLNYSLAQQDRRAYIYKSGKEFKKMENTV